MLSFYFKKYKNECYLWIRNINCYFVLSFHEILMYIIFMYFLQLKYEMIFHLGISSITNEVHFFCNDISLSTEMKKMRFLNKVKTRESIYLI